MAPVVSDPVTLTLHAVRLLGFADAVRGAHRFRQGVGETGERLLDLEAVGWVSHSEFGGTEGWSMTVRGRAEPRNDGWPPSWMPPTCGLSWRQHNGSS